MELGIACAAVTCVALCRLHEIVHCQGVHMQHLSAYMVRTKVIERCNLAFICLVHDHMCRASSKTTATDRAPVAGGSRELDGWSSCGCTGRSSGNAAGSRCAGPDEFVQAVRAMLAGGGVASEGLTGGESEAQVDEAAGRKYTPMGEAITPGEALAPRT